MLSGGRPAPLALKRKFSTYGRISQPANLKLEPQRDQVRLTMIHDQFEPGSEVLGKVSQGWPLVLSSLKSYVECGKVLHAPWYEDQPLVARKVAR
jgi:hypothetical protein